MIAPGTGSTPSRAAMLLTLAALALGCAALRGPPPAPAPTLAEATAEDVRGEGPQVGSVIDKDAVRRVVRSHASELRLCYQQRLATDPALAGKITLRWTVHADGAVSEAVVVADSTTLHDEPLHRCLTAAVEHWRFPELAGAGVVKLTYPFTFRPAAE